MTSSTKWKQQTNPNQPPPHIFISLSLSWMNNEGGRKYFASDDCVHFRFCIFLWFFVSFDYIDPCCWFRRLCLFLFFFFCFFFILNFKWNSLGFFFMICLLGWFWFCIPSRWPYYYYLLSLCVLQSRDLPLSIFTLESKKKNDVHAIN